LIDLARKKVTAGRTFESYPPGARRILEGSDLDGTHGAMPRTDIYKWIDELPERAE